MSISRRAVVLLVALLTLVLVHSELLAREANVTMKDGRVLTGEVIEENADTITLRISGIATPLLRSDIEQLEYKLSLDEQYRERRAAVADDDLDGRYLIAYWLSENKVYALAKRELDDLQSRITEDTPVDVANRIRLLSRVVEERMKVVEAVPGPRPEAPVEPQPEATTGPDGLAPVSIRDITKLPKLKAADINLIRVYEVDLTTARKPNIIVPRDVIEDILTKYREHPSVPKGRKEQSDLRSAQGWQKLDLIFKLRAREYYSKVEVRGDPPAMQTFRTNIHNQYVLSYCGTVECHGGPNAGSMLVFRDRESSDETVYTNFFILQSYELGRYDMISRDSPDNSLLIQFGLPRNQARVPHPDVRGWRQRLSDPNDRMAQNISGWIRQLYSPAPPYGIEYTPPRFKQPSLPPDDSPWTEPQSTPQTTEPPAEPAETTDTPPATTPGS